MLVRRLGLGVVLVMLACSSERPSGRTTAPELATTTALLESGDTSSRLLPPIAPMPDRSGRLVMRRREAAVFFADAGLAWSARANGRGWGLSATVVGARAGAMHGDRPNRSRVHDLVGPAATHVTNAPAYARVLWDEIRPGVDMVAEPAAGGVAYRFVLAPGANLSDLTMRWDGATALRPAMDGRGLELQTAIGTLRVAGLRAFSVRGTQRTELPARHVVVGNDVSFAVDGWDGSTPLLIDPTVSWSSYLGGSGEDTGTKVAVDTAGNAFVVGTTASTDFPTMGAFDTTYNGGDLFVTKISPAGAVLWSSYLGGSNTERSGAIAVDPGGNVFVTGSTISSDFPAMGGFDTTPGVGGDGFVTKLTSAGTIAWSSYVGGDNYDEALAVATDPSGNVFVTGDTLSSDFPTTGGFDTTKGAIRDAFVTKISGAGALMWSSLLGGSADQDYGRALATDSSGNVIIGGVTDSADFPQTTGLGNGRGYREDTFITKLSATGALAWSQVRSSSDNDAIFGVATDASGNVFAVGTAAIGFPIAGGFNPSGSIGGAFVLKLNAAGGHVWSTRFTGTDDAHAVAVDGLGNVVVVGKTSTPTFPTTGGFDTTIGGTMDGFVVKLSNNGALFWGSFLGGSEQDEATGVGVDGANNIVVAGETPSSDFSTLTPFDSTLGGTRDAFVTRLTFLARGAVCTSSSKCATSYCVDGVCCDKACTGGCEACSAAKKGSGADGTCAVVAKGTDPKNACPADPGFPASCRSDGMCDGAGACNLWAPINTPCGGVICAAGTVSGFVCNGGGTCADDTRSCAPYACDAMGKACRTTCAADAECSAAAFCGTTGTCVDKKANGSSCGKAVECTSGQCVDGVCCNSACAGQCESCNETGKEGTCSPISGSPKGSRSACLGAGTCAGTCDGVNGGSCAYKVGTECGSSCAAGAETISRCDNMGACTAGAPQGCNGLTCDGSSKCKTACATSADCETGFSCAAGKCAPTQCSADGTSVISEGKETSCSPSLCKGGRCVEACGSSSDCASGFVCNPTSSKCEAPPAAAEDDGGCMYGRSSNGSALLVLAAMLGLARRRRVAV